MVNILDGKTGQGGASPHTGGREERPPRLSSPVGTGAAKVRWTPPSCVKRDANTLDEKNDVVFRRVRGILNKLTPEKFDKLSLELLNVGIESQVILKGVILLIFEKALDEPKYSSMYAQLCHRLCEDAPNFEPTSSTITTFRRLLLNKCQDEFENRSKASEAFDGKDSPLTDEETEQYHLAKRKMLGNIKFVGELGKLEMLHEGILHKCIKQLLEKKKNIIIRDMAEDLECLCQIMRTVGRRLDSQQARAWMEQYFSRVKSFANHQDLPARIRFMLQDVIELRGNKWIPRHVASERGPRTISQIRHEVASESGHYPSQGQNRTVFGHGHVRPAMNGSLGPQWKGPAGNFEDIFGMSPASMLGSIGTGPGVIPMDYTPNYNAGMGRPRNNQQNQGFNNFITRQDGGSPREVRSNQQNSQSGGRQSPQNQQQPPSGQMQQQRPGSGSRDLPPRFARLAGNTPPSGGSSPSGSIGGGSPAGSKEEISLRPAKNFMLFKPNTPNALPKSAQTSSHPVAPIMSLTGNAEVAPGVPNPLLSKQTPITIKLVSLEKNKPNKRAAPSKEEVQKTTEKVLADYLEKVEINDALNTFKDLQPPKKYIADIITWMMTSVVEKNDDEREKVTKLMAAMKNENLMTSDQYMEGFRTLLEQMPDLEADVPLIKSHVAKFGAIAVTENIASLSELAEPMENGAQYPLFLLCLQQMHKYRDKDWLVTTFNESKINLQDMLPEIDRNKDRMMEILEDRGLSFMFPLLRVQSELWRQIIADPNATSVYKWIKDKVDTNLHTDPGFIHILTTNLLKYTTLESSLTKGVDPMVVPDKAVQEKEKEILSKMKGVLQLFLHDHLDLQVSALYATQVFCHNHQFPKGMLLRFFCNFYDMEIVEEESFLRWKEEISDEYPGKGKALFQVNQWLTWLEQAEEESEEESEQGD